MKKIVSFFLFSLSLNAAFAQQMPNNVNGSTSTDPGERKPKGQSSGMGIYNVNLFDGTASVNVPIFDYQVDGLPLGVSLGYDTRGIRVDQVASSVGLGWNLAAGGSIDRSVYGIEDDQELPELGIGYWSGPPNPTSTHSWAFADRVKGTMVDGWSTSPPAWIQCDREDDEFTANFAGRSIKFTMPHSGSVLNSYVAIDSTTLPKSYLAINLFFVDQNGVWRPYTVSNRGTYNGFENASIHPTSVGIQITDEGGNQFFFTRGDYQKKYYSVDRVTDVSNKEPYKIYAYTYYPTTRWVLTKVITHTGAVVKYNYTQYDGLSYAMYRDEEVTENQNGYDKYENSVVIGTENSGYTRTDSNAIWQGGISVLSSIDYPNGTTVNFKAGTYQTIQRCDLPGFYALDSIVIHSGYDNQVKKELSYKLNYSYFASAAGNNTTTTWFPYSSPCSTIGLSYSNNVTTGIDFLNTCLRLRLDSIQSVGTDHASRELYYSFLYKATSLPSRMSPAQDFFGYCNGKIGSASGSLGSISATSLANSSIPVHTAWGSSTSYGIDRSTDLFYMQANSLVKVMNGKHGALDLYYQNHSLSYDAAGYGSGNLIPNDLEGRTTADGLCIQKIVESDGYNEEHTTIKTYNFSGGLVFYQGAYCWYPTAIDDHYSGTMYSMLNRTYTNNYLQPRELVNGSNHGYSHVDVVTTTGTSNTLVNTESYDYNNVMDHFSGISNLNIITGHFSGNYTGVNENYLHYNNRAKYFHTHRLGKVWKSQLFDNNNVLVKKVETTYPSFTGSDHWSAEHDAEHKTVSNWSIDLNTGNAGLVTSDFGYELFIDRVFNPLYSNTTTYAGSASIASTKYYNYDDRNVINRVSTALSNGDSLISVHEHAYDFSWGFPVNYCGLLKTWLYRKNGSGTRLMDMHYYVKGYTSPSPTIMDLYTEGLKVNAPVTTFSQANDVHRIDSVVKRDASANVTELLQNETDRSATIWDMRLGKPIASASNAAYDDIAYTSFEGPFAAMGIADDNKGNWDFNPANIVLGSSSLANKSLTGSYQYHLVNGSGNQILSKNGLRAGERYVLSFWSTALPSVDVTVNNGPSVSTFAATMTPVRQLNGWTLYTCTITGANGGLNIYNSGSTVISMDELRLHPLKSTMTTTTYQPLLGPDSQCDNLNNITYYEYDIMGRPSTVRDIDNNIISYQKTVVQGLD